MKPLEGIWWGVPYQDGSFERADLQGCDLPGVWGVRLKWGARDYPEWLISAMIGDPGHSWQRTIAHGPCDSGTDPREAAWEWCRYRLAPTVRAHRAAQTRRRARWAQGRKDEEEA